MSAPPSTDPLTITTATSSAGSATVGGSFIQSGTAASSIGIGMKMREPTCEVNVAGITFPHYEPPPNAVVRFFQKHILGITWRDLRPERAMQDLKGLK